MYISRRRFGALVVLMGMTACSGPITPSQVVQDVALVANAFNSQLVNLSTLVPANIRTTIQNAIAAMLAAATAFQTAATQSAQQPIVQQIMTDVNAVFGALTGVANIPANIQSLINDVNALLPIIETAVGLIIVGAVRNDWTSNVTAHPTADQARLDLRKMIIMTPPD